MRWVRALLKRFSEDARLRFFLGVGLGILVPVYAAIRWGGSPTVTGRAARSAP